jgi:hypothetical protein
LLHSYLQTLTSNPELLNFPPPCQRFSPTQRTLVLSLFLFFIKQWWRSWGEWGGQMWKGTNLSLARTHTNISPPNPHASWPITLLRKIHSRCWRSSPAKKKYTAPPYTDWILNKRFHSQLFPFQNTRYT